MSFPSLETLHRRYVDAVRKELRSGAEKTELRTIDTVFLGGGTPTVLPVGFLLSLLETCREYYSVKNDAEISIETNPGTVTKKDLLRFRQAGVNRISIGIQSFLDSELEVLGRRYSSEKAKTVFREARSAGFDNISVDLMFGLPGQNHREWERNLIEMSNLQPDHLSCYQLTVEDGTPFAERIANGDFRDADEDEVEKMDELTGAWARAAGLHQYEISNFARLGLECRHNINYWLNGNYHAAGAAAVSCINGRRKRRISLPLQYCKMIEEEKDPVTDEEMLDQEASFRESVVMGLRLVRGVRRQDLFARYGIDVQAYYGSLLLELLDQDLLKLDDTYLRLTARGRRLANKVMMELV